MINCGLTVLQERKKHKHCNNRNRGVALVRLQILEKPVVHMAALKMVESIDCVPQHLLHTISVHMIA